MYESAPAPLHATQQIYDINGRLIAHQETDVGASLGDIP